MKKKTLIIATMVAAMVALAGCGKEDIPEKKDKSKKGSQPICDPFFVFIL